MSNKLCFALSVLLTAAILLAACLPSQRSGGGAPVTAQVQPTTIPAATAVPVQPTTAPGATAAPVQPTTAPGEISQSGDLCGGTGGNGQIVSVGNNSFTLERNDGRSLIVNLTDHATIETSTGFVSLSDLKIGDRVTLVGDDNRDGTFTADAVVVCNGTVP